MAKDLVFATNNKHKLQEVRSIVGEDYNILSLDDIGCHEDIPETGRTLQENAIQKARFIKDRYGYDCFADDTGLIVEALGGEPGVYSARYAGPECDAEANMYKLLWKMHEEKDRSARFTTVIALIEGDTLHTFEGTIEGDILEEKTGRGGFGYDPIFRPYNSSFSFAEMSAEQKNAISHRGKAMAALIAYLQRKQ